MDKDAVHNLVYPSIQRAKQKIPDAQVVDQFAALIDYVDEIERLAVLAVLAHIIEHFFHRPILPHRNKVRCHQTANAAFRVTKKRGRYPPLLRGEQPNQLPSRRAWHLFE